MTGSNTPFTPSGSAGSSSHLAGRATFGQAASSTMGMKWSALHDAAGIVATLAGLPPEPMHAELRNFPAVARDAGGWQRDMAEQGVDDLTVIMETGIGALLAVHARGIDSRPAAVSLWNEFIASRRALLGLVPQSQGLRRAF